MDNKIGIYSSWRDSCNSVLKNRLSRKEVGICLQRTRIKRKVWLFIKFISGAKKSLMFKRSYKTTGYAWGISGERLMFEGSTSGYSVSFRKFPPIP